MFRLATYNVHRCLGTDRTLDIARIAEVLAHCRADIICLQELDVGRARTGGIDQARAIADHLSMDVHFNAAMTLEAEQYGDAILTHLPERLVKRGALPTVRGVPGLEPRGALWVEVEAEGQRLNVLTTHLGLVPREQRLQAEALAGPEWLGHADCSGPTILAGDLNVTSISRPYKVLTERLDDAQIRLGLSPSVKTFPASFPAIRIDHLLVSPQIDVRSVASPQISKARIASDHRPLVMEFSLRPALPQP